MAVVVRRGAKINSGAGKHRDKREKRRRTRREARRHAIEDSRR